MAILTEDMKRLVREQGLGFYATVCEDGSPNLSPKGTTRVWDDDHLFFADIRSPQTVANIRRGSLVEINVVEEPGLRIPRNNRGTLPRQHRFRLPLSRRMAAGQITRGLASSPRTAR